MNRRKFLAIGVTGLSGMAGCTGDGSGGSNSPTNSATSKPTTTTTATTTTTQPRESPALSISGIETPNQPFHYQSVTAEVIVENRGESEGTFEDQITSRALSEPIPVSATIPAGQEKRITVEIPYPESFVEHQAEVKFNLSGQSFSLTYTNPTLDLGESVRYPEWAEFAVLEARKIESYSFPMGDGMREVTPRQGELFLALRLTATKTSDADARPPRPRFALQDTDGNYLRVNDETPALEMAEPISGPGYGLEDSFDEPGQIVDGWALLGVDRVPEEGKLVHTNGKYPNLRPVWNL